MSEYDRTKKIFYAAVISLVVLVGVSTGYLSAMALQPEPQSAVAVITEFNGFTTRHRVFEDMDLQNCLAFAESYSILPTEDLSQEYRIVACMKDYPTGELTQ